MDPSDRTQEKLLAKTESLCNAITDIRNPAPWGGTGYLSNILKAVQMEERSDYAERGGRDGDAGEAGFGASRDYASSAQKEAVVREMSRGLIKTTQEISTLIRDLQELWLFGGLDTLADPADEEASRKKAEAVAQMVGVLAGGKVGKTEEKEKGKEEER